MDKKDFDVFISYSRKDYVDENKNVIPGNIVSRIKAALDENAISYWMDEKGIYNGDEYARLIATYIRRCKIFLFVSTENSNASEWTSDEIATARMYKKKIMPFKYDDSFYNETVILFIAKLDYIDYSASPDHALTKLIESIKKYLYDLEEAKRREEELRQQKLHEEEERKRKQEEERKKEEIRKEIKIHVEDCQRLIVQQESIVKQLINKNIFVGNEMKSCPICNNSTPLNKTFCEKCGWQFPLLYSLDGNDTFICDEMQLSVARTNWQSLGHIVDLQRKNKELEGINKELEDIKKDYENTMSYQERTLDDLSNQCQEQKEQINEKEIKLASFQEDITSLSMQLDLCKQEISQKEEQNQEGQRIIVSLQEEIESLTENVCRFEQGIQQKEDQLNEKIKEYKVLEEKYNKLVKGTPNTPIPPQSNMGKKTEGASKAETYQKTTTTHKKSKSIKSLEEAFSIIETCCNTSPIQDNYDFNRAKLSLNWLKNILGKKYGMYVSKTAILACKNIGELKQLLYNSSNKPERQ